MNNHELAQMDITILPGRVIPPKSRALTGQISLRNGKSAVFESSLERDCLIRLDYDVPGRNLLSQPFTLSYLYQGKKRRYTPDVLVEFGQDEGVPVTVIEVKEKAELMARWDDFATSFAVMRELCRRNRWDFHVLTEDHIRQGATISNINFLRRYLGIPVDPARAVMLLRVLTNMGGGTANELLNKTFISKEARGNGMWILWTLVANQVISFDIRSPLRMDLTVLRISDMSALGRYESAVEEFIEEVAA